MRLIACLIPVLLAGCVVKPSTESELDDSRWKLIEIDERTPVSETGALHFDGAEINATVGCNRMNGNWRVEHGRLIAGPLITTEIGCLDAATFDQERALSALLVAAPQMNLEGRQLLLRSSGHSARFRRLSPPQSSS